MVRYYDDIYFYHLTFQLRNPPINQKAICYGERRQQQVLLDKKIVDKEQSIDDKESGTKPGGIVTTSIAFTDCFFI